MADDSAFMLELLKGIQNNVTEVGRRMDRVDARLTGIEDRMAHMEKRHTAATHFTQSVLVELSGISERLDNIGAQLLGFDRRVDALEARR